MADLQPSKRWEEESLDPDGGRWEDSIVYWKEEEFVSSRMEVFGGQEEDSSLMYSI